MSADPANAPGACLKLKCYQTGDATVIECSGLLTAQFAATLKNEVKPLIRNAKRIVLDLTDLTYMDSSGLGAIVTLYVFAKAASCDLRLINFNKRIRELLGITHLLAVFEACGQYDIRIP